MKNVFLELENISDMMNTISYLCLYIVSETVNRNERYVRRYSYDIIIIVLRRLIATDKYTTEDDDDVSCFSRRIRNNATSDDFQSSLC